MRIVKLTIGIVFLILTYSCYNNDNKAGTANLKGEQSQQVIKPQNDTLTLFKDFNDLNTKIRNEEISKDSAFEKFNTLLIKIKDYYYKYRGKDYAKSDWVFPLQGYNSSNIGGPNGCGYIPDGFNYFDGNKRKGHPAHDIFINDRNEDKIDDYTHKPANVLSMTEGIVIARETKWDSTSNMQGGNYIYIYVPSQEQIVYYAHNDSVKVKPGDFVIPGKVIATVGRSGKNAFAKRSPTHLHIMFMQLDKNLFPKPINPYSDLLKVKTIKN